MREGFVSAGVTRRLKQAARELIALAGGNGDAAALAGVSEGLMSRYGGDHHREVMPLDVAAALEMRAGRPVVSAVLADLTGYRVAPICEGEAPAPELSARLMDVVATGAQVTAMTAEALRDGAVCPREARAVLPAIGKARAALDDMERDVAARLTPRGAP